MSTLFLDIETIPVSDPDMIADIIASIKPPKTLKKAESIEKWWIEEGEAAKEEAIAKTGLDGTYGQVCCIGWAVDDEPAKSLIGDEKAIIADFFCQVESLAIAKHYAHPIKTHMLVGHNLAAFDLRFLWQRAVINGIPRPKSIPWNAKPWELQDTMLLWNPDRDKRISLDRLCKVLGVPTSKGELDGSKIAQAWRDGRHAEIADYCRADVEATRECWRKMK
jgi:predicted PolB exonuclease-like 3'-5' exonuclease